MAINMSLNLLFDISLVIIIFLPYVVLILVVFLGTVYHYNENLKEVYVTSMLASQNRCFDHITEACCWCVVLFANITVKVF